jgi:hypothetical protein
MMKHGLRTIWFSPKFVIGVVGVTALVFNNWLLAPFLDGRVLAAGGPVSDLSVTTEPHAAIFRALDVLAGVLFVIVALLLAKKLPKTKAMNVIIGVTAVLGFANVVDAVIPLNCAEALAGHCKVAVDLSLSHYAMPSHGYSSIIIGAIYFVLPIAGLVYARQKQLHLLASVSIASLVAACLSLVPTVQHYILHQPASGSLWELQQLEMVMIGMWFVVLFSPLFSSQFAKSTTQA